MAAPLDYLDHLCHDSTRFAAVLRDAAPDTRVPSCPDWTADDLLWHLGEVQWFWGTIVREGITDTARAQELRAQELEPQRPPDRAGLLGFYEQASRDLTEALIASPSQTPAWTWAPDHTVGFIRRRQAHEALIHRVDAELTAGDRTPMDPVLSADGIDEALRVMYAAPTGRLTPTGRTVRVLATDTGSSWVVILGIAGTEPGFDVADRDRGGEAAATVSGPAADLDCWLWNRPAVGRVERAGDRAAVTGLESAIAAGVD